MRRVEGRRQETPVFGQKMYVNHPLVLGRLPTKASLPQRLHIRAATRWPQLADAVTRLIAHPTGDLVGPVGAGDPG